MSFIIIVDFGNLFGEGGFQMISKKDFVSGCYDLLHSGHVEFFRQASEYGDLYVGICSDETILRIVDRHK